MKAAQAHGLHAERRALKGAADDGDIHVQHGKAVIEVKAGKQAAHPSLAQLDAWWQEADAEAGRVLACDLAVLVTKRAGSADPAAWTAYVDLAELVHVLDGVEIDGGVRVALPLGVLLRLLAGRWLP